jgi:hypothetical protein
MIIYRVKIAHMQAAIFLLANIPSNKVFNISVLYDKCLKFHHLGLKSVCQLNIGLSDICSSDEHLLEKQHFMLNIKIGVI